MNRTGPEVSEQTARRMARNIICQIYWAGSGHPGGSLSAVDILLTVAAHLQSWNVDRAEADRDHFVLSKGHAAPALYALGLEKGWLSPAELSGFRRLGSPLQGHPDVVSLPWVGTSTGSLGQGFSVALGMAMAIRHLGGSGRVVALLGDGELQEGEIWEGAMAASHHRLTNFCAIVDYNKLQSDDLNANIIGLEPLADKWRAFGWRVMEVDGHDHRQLTDGLQAAWQAGRPTVLIAHTVKGYRVSFMENSPLWHGSVKLSRDEAVRALTDLGCGPDKVEEVLAGAGN
ncbi:MAG: transketolase [Negativicutes bacterium]|nr:transketolase [Negativicutes bacterium]